MERQCRRDPQRRRPGHQHQLNLPHSPLSFLFLSPADYLQVTSNVLSSAQCQSLFLPYELPPSFHRHKNGRPLRSALNRPRCRANPRLHAGRHPSQRQIGGAARTAGTAGPHYPCQHLPSLPQTRQRHNAESRRNTPVHELAGPTPYRQRWLPGVLTLRPPENHRRGSHLQIAPRREHAAVHPRKCG